MVRTAAAKNTGRWGQAPTDRSVVSIHVWNPPCLIARHASRAFDLHLQFTPVKQRYLRVDKGFFFGKGAGILIFPTVLSA